MPTTMANLAVANGYRTANSGTAWAFYSFVADYFNFNEYYTTSNFDTAMNYLKTDADNDGSADYFVVVSCGSGLFTSGGHYIVLVADNSGTITVYDPYLYNGKFTTASRKNAGVVVSGNSTYVSESAFKTYANYKYFWIFSNDKGSGNLSNNSTSSNSTTSVNYTKYVATQSSNLNVRNSAGGSVISSLKKGTAVDVVEIKGDWSKINSPVSGWVSTQYLSSTTVNTSSTATNTTTGNYYRLKSKSYIYENSNLSGTRYSFLANTQIKVLSNINNSVDYIEVVKTGRKGYISKSAYSNSVSAKNATTQNTIGQYKILSQKCYLYSNSNLTGRKYSYLANTRVKIIKNMNGNVDYVYIPATKRYAYIEKKYYK